MIAPPAARSIAYALFGPVELLATAVITATLAAGVALSVVAIGLPLVLAALAAARAWGGLERRVARQLLGVTVAAPVASGSLVDPAGWRAVLFLLARVPGAVLALGALGAGYGLGLAEVSYPLWFRAGGPYTADGVTRPDTTQVVGHFYLDSWPRALGAALAGALLVVAGTYAVRGLLVVQRALLPLLGPPRGAASARVAELEARRNAAVDAAAAALRRIERDLHDGAQARLVTVAIDLGRAREALGPALDVDQARALVEVAHGNVTAALAELRDLARGIHPPALDEGLGPALAELADRAGLPVALTVEAPARPERPAAAIESIAYFCAAELLTNAVKHSGARQVNVHLRQNDATVTLRVTDDGAGGADPARGSGLTGLAERVEPVDGRLDVASPAGGPTVVTVTLPVR
jgi:signal transduction histidine kinase